ncbi:hypothetical protein ACYZT4_06120 [Pseudomonas sp. GB2N2]
MPLHYAKAKRRVEARGFGLCTQQPQHFPNLAQTLQHTHQAHPDYSRVGSPSVNDDRFVGNIGGSGIDVWC